MRRPLLILVTALITTLTSFGQVPVNDLLGNAIQINSFPYTNTNVRLDLATSSSISPPDCGVGTFPLVYYKFTATNSLPSQLTITIEDASSGTIGSSFAIGFTAPSLNIVDETELTSIASDCAFSTSTTIDLIQGTNYYILVQRTDSNAFSNIIFEVNEVTPVPTIERDALIALYNSTNGGQWTNNTLWNSTESVGSWYGVNTMAVNGILHVSSINLGGNNLTGTIPSEIGAFPSITYLGLWGNQITGNIPPEIGNLTSLVELDVSPNNFSGNIPVEIGNLINLEILWLNQNGLTGSIPASFQNLVNLRQLYLAGAVGTSSGDWADSSYSGEFPDLTALPLELLKMENNFFQFGDIADEFATYQANIANFVFNPQFTVDPPEELASDVGEDIVLTLTEVPNTTKNGLNKLSGNAYQWLKDDVEINGANASSYTILNAQNTDSGIYTCQITNPDTPGFIITRTGITLNVGTLGVDSVDFVDVSIYPNPVSDVLTISIPMLTKSKLLLYDVSGRLIVTQDIESIIYQLDMNQLQSGMYVLRLENELFTTIKNIIKK